MPIKPPNLDDRRYADIVREARALIPQYCPEWTNLGDADPGITLVQLFAWMTEMTIFRLNRVPDKTYVHFLNFIGEERRAARPAMVPLTFETRSESDGSVEIPPYSRCSTKQREGAEALHYLTVAPLTVHDCNIERVVSVQAGIKPTVREISFQAHPACAKALLFGHGRGVQFLKMDNIEFGPRAFTPYQYLYLAHDDFRLMGQELEDGSRPGRLRVRTSGAENLPIGAIFRWQYYSGPAEDGGWVDIPVDENEAEVLGLPEVMLKTLFPGFQPLEELGHDELVFDMPKPVASEKWWIRGVVDYERWLAHRMNEDLEVTWRDDRGGEERTINNWEVRATGRNLEFFIQDMPPIRSGWTVRLAMIDRSVPAGRNSYLPRYRWMYRRNEVWEEIPGDRVRYQGTSIVLTGPFNDMANDGYNLRAERIETVFVRGFLRDLDAELTWVRPIEYSLGAGPETAGAVPLPLEEAPFTPFQPLPNMPAMLGMKLFIGSDLFENRARKSVLIEVEVSFDKEGEPFQEDPELYSLQMTYRAADGWRVVYTPEGTFNEFTFQDLLPATSADKRRLSFSLDPTTQLKGIHRAIISGRESCWLRIEMTKAQLTHKAGKKDPALPVALKIHDVRVALEENPLADSYEQALPGPRVAMVELREHNRRLTRVITRAAGRLAEDYPFDRFIDIREETVGEGADRKSFGHQALYFQFNKPLPPGRRHAIQFKTRGETYLPDGVQVEWEMLQKGDRGGFSWTRLALPGQDDGAAAYQLNVSGELSFSMVERVAPPQEGVWMRARFTATNGEDVPPLPPLTHVLLNTVDGVNLHAFRMEKFSGYGTPHQTVQLRHYPVFILGENEEAKEYAKLDRFEDIRVWVTEDGEKREWRMAPGNTLLTATKDDRVFIIDPVEGSITFGNGIRGKIVPVGDYNIAVEVYHTVPGDAGNVGAGGIAVAEGYNDVVKVTNLLPASGGRNAESIEEIIRRAPSILTSRDRAVTRLDFEIIAKEASGEVARAACDGRMSKDGEVTVVILPHRREGEKVPDVFLSTGLKDHVQEYLSQRCLVNVSPVVRLSTFQEVDVSVTLRLRPNANVLQVREKAKVWVDTFLDPYVGGLDGNGWPFSGTLFSQDFGRMVTDLPEVRHVVNVHLFEVDPNAKRVVPGWEAGEGTNQLFLEQRDLFVLRKVRIITEEEA